ncbi:hypothetical protein BRD10_02700 [Halobacteriales archaeon SW_12_71_31]|nr:MAG: hypothetical protein BRD10_02700 [Halobacteriales archaeon SW_12_71_31]
MTTARSLPDCGGIDVFDSLLVRQRVDDADAARTAVAAWADGRDGDVHDLLPVEGVTLATLFLDRGPASDERPGPGRGDGDALLWYLEVVDDDAPAWRDPARTVREASPLFDGPLADRLAGATAHRDWNGDGDGDGDHLLLTHATHPRRQERYAEHCGPSLVAPVAGDDLPIPVAVVTLRLRPGLRSRLTWHTGRLVDRLKSVDAVDRRAREQTDVIEAEAMYSESLLLERRPASEGHLLHYYTETESMERLYEAYEASDHWAARLSDWLFRRLLLSTDAERLLVPPLESDCEVLVHAVDPARP